VKKGSKLVNIWKSYKACQIFGPPCTF